MHTLFRTLGQQMGIQEVRGILPESIDRFLNLNITKKVRNVLTENGIINFQNRVAIQRNELQPINALRTLYKVKTIDPSGFDEGKTYDLSAITDLYIILGFSICYNEETTNEEVETEDLFYKCRIIDDIELETTRFDYCNKDSKEYPIVTISLEQIEQTTATQVAKFYCGNATPKGLKIRYIKKPAIVNKLASTPIDCDLPEYLHTEIVELAVKDFMISLGMTLPRQNNKS